MRSSPVQRAGPTRKKYVRSLAGRPAADVNVGTYLGRLGARIRHRRNELSMTLEDVAAATGGNVSATMLSQYESGSMEPRVTKLVAIAAALRTHPVDLYPPETEHMILTGEGIASLARGGRGRPRPAAVQ